MHFKNFASFIAIYVVKKTQRRLLYAEYTAKWFNQMTFTISVLEKYYIKLIYTNSWDFERKICGKMQQKIWS